MKWTIPSEGDTRVVRRFLWFPAQFGTDWRWLEFAWLAERYVYPSCPGDLDRHWHVDGFVSRPRGSPQPERPGEGQEKEG